MQRYKVFILALALSLTTALGVATVSQAKWSDNIQDQDKVTVASGQNHQGSLYATGDQIVVNGTVEGDLYCAGRELIISGEVTGDVLCAAQNITIDGKVGQDIRVAGQYVSLNGEVAGSVTFFGQDLKLLSDSRVGGDINGAGQIVTLGGPVGGDVLIGSERLSVQSTVGGDVNAGTTRIELTGGAQIAGDLNYAAESKLSVDESRIAGEVNYNSSQHNQSRSDMDTYGWLIFMLVSMLLCALLVAVVAPRFVERTRVVANRNFALVALVGFAVAFGTPILAVSLMLTVVLLPVGILMMLLWASAMLVSNALVAYWLGSLVFASQRNILIRMATGVAILFVLYLIPVVNFLVGVMAVVVGSGMVASTLFDGYKRPSYSLAKATTTKKRK